MSTHIDPGIPFQQEQRCQLIFLPLCRGKCPPIFDHIARMRTNLIFWWSPRLWVREKHSSMMLLMDPMAFCCKPRQCHCELCASFPKNCPAFSASSDTSVLITTNATCTRMFTSEAEECGRKVLSNHTDFLVCHFWILHCTLYNSTPQTNRPSYLNDSKRESKIVKTLNMANGSSLASIINVSVIGRTLCLSDTINLVGWLDLG